MYKIMIADDEEPVLESFSLIINRDVKQFELCAAARSGYEAIELFDDLKPDVVFMDIQMPGIDGIETIRRIRQDYPGTVFILATAFERFDIAKKAISLGIFSYLVKPISRRTFLEELDKVHQYLDKRKERRSRSFSLEQDNSRDRERLEQRYLTRLSRGELEKEEWQAFEAFGRFQTDRAAFFIIGNWQEGMDDLKNRLNYRYLCFSARMGNRLLLLFPEIQELSGVYQTVLECLADLSGRDDPEAFTVGCGGIYSFQELSHSYREALEPFLTDWDNSAKEWEREQLLLLRGYLKRGERMEFTECFKDFYNHQFSHCSFDLARGKMIEAFTLFRETMDWYVPGDHYLDEFSAVEEIALLNNEKEWELWWPSGISRILADIKETKGEPLPQPLEKAISYIQENYQEPIYLGSVAEACQVSTGYLSRLFSEHLETTFVNYLNSLRTDKALELLKRGDLNIKEIAFRTGYQDPNYFSRIFRKFKGCSPSEVC